MPKGARLIGDKCEPRGDWCAGAGGRIHAAQRPFRRLRGLVSSPETTTARLARRNRVSWAMIAAAIAAPGHQAGREVWSLKVCTGVAASRA